MSYTRITNSSVYSSVLNSMYDNTNKMSELQQQISSGKRVDNPSDDASATIDIMNSNESLRKIDVYTNNINNARSELEIAESQLDSATEIVHRAKDLATQASNATYSADELENMNKEIEQLIESLKGVANAQYGDKFIFAGVNVSSPPFTSPADGEVEYNGTPQTGNYQRKVEISDGITTEINIPGDQVFGYYMTDPTAPPAPPDPPMIGSGLFQTLSVLSENLQTDPPDRDAIAQALDDLDEDLQNVINARAQIGGIMNRIDMTKNSLANDKINYQKVKTNAEGLDVAKAISDLKFQETTLQASLSVSGKLLDKSLINYI